ncbi:MAG: tRNA (guanosine(37)-N1)-methyltransferase TrmD [Spirochaetes bacterium]|nr:tRNA (guanosine(37)-N1)-methyltransferase TrmD [Spirochaetota bacterium]
MKACSTFKIITLFPEFFRSPLDSGLLGKAVQKGLIRIDLINLRDFSKDRHRRCDDYPYGGGSGMVLMAEPAMRALDAVKTTGATSVLTSPGGAPLSQTLVKELSAEDEICILCGNYEGIDQRVIDSRIDIEISVGDYILSGGEFAALVVIDAVSRYVPGFMSNSDSLREESFESDLLEYPHYTRPAVIGGMEVPGVLLNGNHGEIERWRLEKRIEKTGRTRPDLYRRFIKRKLLGE